MNLPEGVQTFFLLNAANVSEDNEKLACATVGEITYEIRKQKYTKYLEILLPLKAEVVHLL